VLLGLKFAELRYYEDKTGVRPILLLDDLSSELDSARREFLLRFLQETQLQVFVTMTDDLLQSAAATSGHAFSEAAFFEMAGGALCRLK
jgi:DNA replication and repair protein RecF